MATYHLHRWAVSVNPDEDSWYVAPEARSMHLIGFRDEEPRQIITSRIVGVQGREVKTASGSTYILEDISPDYLRWLDENGFEVNPDNPVLFIKRK